MSKKQWIQSLIGILIAFTSYGISAHYGLTEVICRTIGVSVLIAYLWITETISIYLTSILPLILFPLLDIAGIDEISPKYMKDIIFLFIGGFLLAFGIEKVHLHQRIAYWFLIKAGNNAGRLLLSFMFISYFLSMWILNTATTLLLIPPALGIINEIKKQNPTSKFHLPILLGIAYCASIGGITTVIGTAPNAYLFDFLKDNYPDVSMSFGGWTLHTLPISLLMFLAVYTYFYFKFIRNKPMEIDAAYCKNAYQKLGPFSSGEKKVLVVFLLTVLLWFSKKHLGFIHPILPEMKDSWIALSMSFLLFFIRDVNKASSNILEWNDMSKIPLGVIFLFGAGFAINHVFETSGLMEVIGVTLQQIELSNGFLLLSILIIFMVFFTEISSNTTSTILIIPLIALIVDHGNYTPISWLLPICVSASFAFMLPVATPPNTIIYGTEMISIKEMMKHGFWVNLIGIAVLLGWIYFSGF